MKRGILGLGFFCFLILPVVFLADCATTPESGERGDIRVIVPAGQGGGADKLTRFWIGLNIRSHYTDRTIKPVNQPGGAGGLAMRNMVGRYKGNGNVVLAVSNFVVTTPLFQDLPFSFRDLTPVAVLSDDNFVLWVHKDSPWQNAREFIQEARDRSVTVGGTGSKQEDEIVFRGVEKAVGTKPFHYVPYKGGGYVARELVEKRLEATVNQISELGAYYPEKVRPLCVFQEERLTFEGYEDVPTCREAGIPFSYHYFRGIVAPPGITEEAREELVDLFRGISEDKDWVTFTEKVGMKRVFLTGGEMMTFLEDFEAVNKRILMDQGWIKPDEIRF